MSSDDLNINLSALLSSVLVALMFLAGFLALATRLKAVQIDGAAEYKNNLTMQAERRVASAGLRGRILARGGEVLAGNRLSHSIVVRPENFSGGDVSNVVSRIREAITAATEVVGREAPVTDRAIASHIRNSRPIPMPVWRDISDDEIARFAEHADEMPGFELAADDEREYPYGSLAAHLIGYVGRESRETVAGDAKINYRDKDMMGREGLERYYDSYLQGVPTQRKITVDAAGYLVGEDSAAAFATGSRGASAALGAGAIGADAGAIGAGANDGRGLDLRLNLDVAIQRAVERELEGCRGACVVMDPRDGAVLAAASAPAYDLNRFVPVFTRKFETELNSDGDKPRINRALGGMYAPGSTFKPVTSFAIMSAGISPFAEYNCAGAYSIGGMRIRCARTWGHGELDLAHAIKESCNPYFCHFGSIAGTNAVVSAARAFGLGSQTGIDFPTDGAGVVPDAAFKMGRYNERWYPGDLAQMSIGQGMLLVTPLQMARVAGALGTGYLVTPRLAADREPRREKVNFPETLFSRVREGMRMVVDGGTGRKGAQGVHAYVIGKTGTAEVGRGETRRKNTWFIAYARGDKSSRQKCRDAEVAVALVIENGESGGGTAAPKVCEILKAIFNEPVAESAAKVTRAAEVPRSVADGAAKVTRAAEVPRNGGAAKVPRSRSAEGGRGDAS